MGWRRLLGVRTPSIRTLLLGRSRSSGCGCGTLVFLGLLTMAAVHGAAFAKQEGAGPVIAALVITAVLSYVVLRALGFIRPNPNTAERAQNLTARFGPEIAQAIMQGRIWQGATEEMLRESLGPPAGMDEKVMKSKVRRVFKYQPASGNRYGLRVTVEDGYVVGWETSGR